MMQTMMTFGIKILQVKYQITVFKDNTKDMLIIKHQLSIVELEVEIKE
jgi:hypothetical protein